MPDARDIALVKAGWQAGRRERYVADEDSSPSFVQACAIVASQHICLVCGRTEPCTETPDACTFDPTPQELYEENRRLRQRIEELERQRDARANPRRIEDRDWMALAQIQNELLRKLKAKIADLERLTQANTPASPSPAPAPDRSGPQS